MSLKIAQVPTIDYTVPPNKYGAVHTLVSEMSKSLADRGHEITVFTGNESTLAHPGVELVRIPVEKVADPINPYRLAEINLFLEVFRRQAEFDLIHWHYDPIGLNCNIDGQEINFLDLVKTPTILTLHFSPTAGGPLFSSIHGGNIGFYEYHKNLWNKNYVSISNAQRRGAEFLNFIRTIYHGLDTQLFTYGAGKGDYLLFIGRMSPEKGILEAIEVASRSGKKLKIAARIEDSQRSFYENEVKPLVDGNQIEYVGEVGFPEKIALYQNASATLVPIKWDEPFGLVMIESISCGTPVLAFNRGSVPEIIKHGKTGFIVGNVDEMVSCVEEISKIDRLACRSDAETRFSNSRMVDEYEETYLQTVGKL